MMYQRRYIGRTSAISIKGDLPDGCHRLSHMFKQVNSVRIGKLIEMNTTTSEFGKQSLFFRGPVTWNNLDRDIRNA